jgi:hypothetical protein
MIVQEVGWGLHQVYMCRKDINVKVAGKAHHFYALHDCGATQTLITHAAAGEAGLMPIRHSARLVSGLGACAWNLLASMWYQ